VVVERMRSGRDDLESEAARGEHAAVVAAGIVDPTKVVRGAPEDAVSVAGVPLLTEATSTEIPELKVEAALGIAAM
jgi:chaperonin GroEL